MRLCGVREHPPSSPLRSFYPPVWLHLPRSTAPLQDYISDAVHAVNPSCDVRVLPEVGFFIDGKSIWGGARIMTDVYARIALFANITTGAPEQVNAACVAATPAADRAHCFMAQYTLPHIRTPLFILNSQVDEWQTQNVLAPNVETVPHVTTYAPFVPCITHPVSGCNATQRDQWLGYGTQFLAALAAARAATPSDLAARHGGFITSCPIHTTNIGGLSHRISIGGVSMYSAYSRWWLAPPTTPASWTIDEPFPADRSCPAPGAESHAHASAGY